MNLFREKWIVYFDLEKKETVACQICKSFEYHKVFISIGDFEDVKFDDFGTPSEMRVSNNHVCSYSSWQQYVNRYFPSKRFVKVREMYYY